MRRPDVTPAEDEHVPGVVVRLPSVVVRLPSVQAPPPALASIHNCAHVGLTPAEWSEHTGWMARSPRWRASVIEASKKRRFAAPADVVASMRDRYAATSTPAKPAPVVDEDAALDAALDAELGIVDAPPPSQTKRTRARRAGR